MMILWLTLGGMMLGGVCGWRFGLCCVSLPAFSDYELSPSVLIGVTILLCGLLGAAAGRGLGAILMRLEMHRAGQHGDGPHDTSVWPSPPMLRPGEKGNHK